MKIFQSLVVLIILVFAYSCTKDIADIRMPDFAVPIVNGYYARDQNGNLIMPVGDPNVRLFSGSDAVSSAYSFGCYPNPSANYCFIYINAPAGQTLKKLWITQAIVGDRFDSGSENIYSPNLAVGGAPIFQAEFTSDHLTVDVSKLSDGYYRIYLKVDDFLLYDNLLVYKSYKYMK
jgi:hypothetical protein